MFSREQNKAFEEVLPAGQGEVTCIFCAGLEGRGRDRFDPSIQHLLWNERGGGRCAAVGIDSWRKSSQGVRHILVPGWLFGGTEEVKISACQAELASL